MPEPGERRAAMRTPDDEADLVARARHDRGAFAPVYRYCYARLGGREAAEDGVRWLRFRTEDGPEGWVREIDVRPDRD